ncbi:MAG: NTP transferase domain-containing protein, partial [Thermodesulfobacteriota bacterium]
AGMSKRMDSPKQLLRIGGKPLLQHILDNVDRSAVDEIILVLGFEADSIRRDLSENRACIVVNSSYKDGMSTSIQAGIGALNKKTDAVLIILCDQPLIGHQVIDKIISAYKNNDQKIAVPFYKGFRGNPVLIDKSLFPEMMEISGDIGCRAIFGLHPDSILKVPMDDLSILVDIDTQQEFEKISGLYAANNYDMDKTLSALQENIKDIDVPVIEVSTPQLLIIGDGKVTRALAKFGNILGFYVNVIDPLAAESDIPEADKIMHELDLIKAGANGKTYLVIASKGRFDEDVLQQAVQSEIPYIGMMASKKRADDIFKKMQDDGIPADDVQRIRCPVGIDINAVTPQEIALSIMSEIIMVRGMSTHQKPK